MNISRITYFNIGNSADEGQDFFDVLKAGFAIFYGEEKIALVKFQELNKSYKLEIKPYDYEWWEDAAKHVMEVNKLDTSINFLAGLIKSTDQEDNDGMLDFNNEDIELTFDYDNINSELFDVGLFCMKQETKIKNFPNIDSFILENDKMIIGKDKINILDLFGSINEYDSVMTYIN